MGQGLPGPKTRRLREDMDKIWAAGFHRPMHIALTPQFLQRRLMDAGVRPEDDAEEVTVKLMKTSFSREDRKSIQDALMEFPEEARERLIVRSDESADGNGTMDSPRSFRKGAKISEIIDGVEFSVAHVLATGHLDTAKAYKRRTGAMETGILMMPTYGEELHVVGWSNEIAPILELNYLGPHEGGFLLTAATSIIQGSIVNAHENDIEAAARLIEGLEDIDSPRSELRKLLIERINRLTTLAGPRYLEIVADGVGQEELVVVQSAPFSCPHIEKPDLVGYKEDVRTNFVLSIASANTRGCRYLGVKPGEELDIRSLEEYDAAHTNYLLVAEGMRTPGLLKEIYVSVVRNVGAIVIYREEPENPRGVLSHLGGHIRKLGIPVLIVSKPPSFIEELRKKGSTEHECAVYANQFEKEGMVAIRN